jgi:hypothetical protein
VNDSAVSNIKRVHELDVDSYPVTVPGVIVDSVGHGVTCLGWTADPANKLVRTRVTIDTNLEIPKVPNNPALQMQPVQIGQASPSGQKVDAFFMNPSYQSLAVHAATNPSEFATGPIYIVAGRGVKYSVSDEVTAQGLGIANGGGSDGLAAAPESILQLLPSSAQTLSTENVMRTYDSVPVQSNAGYYIPPSSQANGTGGN